MALSRIETKLQTSKADSAMCKQARHLQSKHQGKLQGKAQGDLSLLEDMQGFISKRARLDQEYAANLQKLVAQHLRARDWRDAEAQDSAGLARGFKTVLDAADKLAAAQKDMADSLAKLCEPMGPEAKMRQIALKKFTENGVKLQVEFEKSFRELDRAKKQHEECDAKAQVARMKYEALDKKKGGLALFNSSKADQEAKRQRTTEKMNSSAVAAANSRNGYILAAASAAAFMDYYMATDLPSILTDLDGNIYANVGDYLKRYVECQEEAANELLETCSIMAQTIALISKEADEKVFVAQLLAQTASMLPRDELQPGNLGELSSDIATQDELQRAMHAAVKERARAQKQLGPLTMTVDTVRRQSAAERTSGFSNPESLAKQDSMIFDARIDMIPAQWAVVRCDAAIEVLRRAGVEMPREDEVEAEAADSRSIASTSGTPPMHPNTPQRTPSNLSAKMASVVVRCQAMYPYTASAPDELSVDEDEILTVCEKPVDGWMKCRNARGQEGYVPENYVEILASASPTPEPPAPPPRPISVYSNVSSSSQSNTRQRTALALYDYDADTPDELSFSAGDVIEIVEMDDEVGDGYWRGTCRGRTGAFPSMLVELQ
eukprot:comp23884_c0_seq1/m.41929 comp23884_c0_seq1/g.41929  ORF comp23884_c0_seq1/g.41929 comp23884_c0_seq1/m.41929 type:complete len:607 (-) comp23884_c0_seq1:156-1976(-)